MTSINVEHVFSQGHLLLLHVHSWLSIQLTCALLCLGQWSALNLVKDSDVKASLTNDEVDEGEQVDMLQEGWDIVWLIWQFESWALGLNSKTMFVIYIATNLCRPCMLAGFCSVHKPLSLPLPACNWLNPKIPVPIPAKTHTCNHRCRFPQVMAQWPRGDPWWSLCTHNALNAWHCTPLAFCVKGDVFSEDSSRWYVLYFQVHEN